VSILDSREEIAAAEAKLAAASDEQLAVDLRYWTVAAYDAAADYIELQARQAEVRRLHAEAEHWIGLVAQEVRKRRDAKRSRADG
jgi:hypothetical protein